MTPAARHWAIAFALWLAAASFAAVATQLLPARPTNLVVSSVVLPTATLHGAAVIDESVKATGADPFVILTPPPRPVRSVRIEIIPSRPFGRDFYLYYVSAGAPAGTSFAADAVQPVRSVNAAGTLRLHWELPQTIREWRLDIPDGAEFRVLSIQASATASALASTIERPGGAVLALLVAIALAAAGGLIVWPWDANAPSTERRVVLTLLLPLATLILLLPPFQGPDEGAHWMLAVDASRTGVAAEPAIFRLPDALDPVPMRFRPDVKFDPARFLAPSPLALSSEQMERRRRWLHENYPYAHPYAYPLATAMMAWYPRVTKLPQASLLFYLCRIAAAAAWMALLFYTLTRYRLPFTVLAAFSAPLVLQQHAVVSADVVLNLGAFVVGLLYVRNRETHSVQAVAAMSVVALAVVSIKIIYLPLLVLPLSALAVRIRRRDLFAAVAVLGILAAYPAARLVLREVREMATVLGRDALAERQIAALATTGGWTELIAQYLRYVTNLLRLEAWSGPLGWLDAPLTRPHVYSIGLTLVSAVALDAWRMRASWRDRLTSWRGAVAFAVGGLAFATLTDVALFHLMTTSPGAAEVAGVQVRHFFPIVITAAVLLAVPRDRGGDDATVSPAIVWTCFLVMCARSALLANDLLQRYW